MMVFQQGLWNTRIPPSREGGRNRVGLAAWLLASGRPEGLPTPGRHGDAQRQAANHTTQSSDACQLYLGCDIHSRFFRAAQVGVRVRIYTSGSLQHRRVLLAAPPRRQGLKPYLTVICGGACRCRPVLLACCYLRGGK